MKKRIILIILILLVMLTIVPVLNHQEIQDLLFNSHKTAPTQPLASIRGITAYEIHEPIAILSDSAFESFPGYGNTTHPYLIADYNITHSSETLIHIKNTMVYFKIINCYLNGTGTASDGIYLENVTHGTIESNIICDTPSGVFLWKTSNNNFSGNTIHDCDATITLEDSSSNNTFSNNTVHDCGLGVNLSDSCNNNTLSNNTIYNIGGADGIVLYSSNNNNTLSDNMIHHCIRGINLHSSNNTLSGNAIHDCTSQGIYLRQASNNTVLNNSVYYCNEGIHLDNFCINNTLSSNPIHDCSYGIYLDGGCKNNTLSTNIIHDIDSGIYLYEECDNNTLSSNTIYNCADIGIYLETRYNILSGNTILNCTNLGIFMKSSSNNTIVSNAIYDCFSGFRIENDCNNNTFSGNMIYNCSYFGIDIYLSCNNNTLSDNTIYAPLGEIGIGLEGNCKNNTLSGNIIYSDWGIALYNSDNNTLFGNTIYNCSSYGIGLDNSNNNTIRYNTVYNNSDYGFSFGDTADNIVNWNNFVDNNVGSGFNQSSDEGSNNNINYNYWDDHTSPDNDPTDGIVDTPYNLEGSANNKDHYPLTTPVLPTLSILTPLAQDYETETITVILSGRLVIQYWYYIEGKDNKNQTWTTSVARTLGADGTYILHGYGSDILGNIAHASVTFTIDAFHPTISLTSPTNDTIYPSGKPIEIFVNDGFLDTVLYNWDETTNQTWSGKYETFLPIGETQHILYVYANDSASHWASAMFIFTTDDTTPTITLDSLINDTSHPSGTRIDLTVIDSHLETVLYNWDGTSNTSLNGLYTMVLPSGEGPHILQVYANDSAGNWASAVFAFTTDDTTPTITLDSLINDTSHPSGTRIDLTVIDSHLETVLYNWDGTSNTSLNGLYTMVLPSGEGPHILQVYANDSAGNWASAVFAFTTDDTTPTITLDSLINDTSHPSGTTVDLTVTDSHLETVLYNWDGTSNTSLNGLYTTVLPSGDGPHILRVYANDSAGNWASAVFTFTTDDTTPTITLVSPMNATSHPSGTTINLTVTDSHLETVLYNWDNSTNQTLTVPYNVTLPTEAGQHVLIVYAKDNAGHWTTETYVFTTQTKSSDLGPAIVVGGIVATLAALTGGGFFLLKKKGLNLKDILRRGPPEN
ncbi:MAG: nitrous oxide reductase family maturation protein NosD [Promethearchaeota archaeon]